MQLMQTTKESVYVQTLTMQVTIHASHAQNGYAQHVYVLTHIQRNINIM